MDRIKKHLFGILLLQVLWAFLTLTASYSLNQDMHRAGSTILVSSRTVPRKIFWDGSDVVHESKQRKGGIHQSAVLSMCVHHFARIQDFIPDLAPQLMSFKLC
jgi:hypothetical protein